eukprot:7367800-Prymnesium_polylepis.1
MECCAPPVSPLPPRKGPLPARIVPRLLRGCAPLISGACSSGRSAATLGSSTTARDAGIPHDGTPVGPVRGGIPAPPPPLQPPPPHSLARPLACDA